MAGLIVGLSRRSLSRRARLCLQAAALAVLILYVLPRLIGFFWQLNQPGHKFREEQLWEKPLRVTAHYRETA